MALFKEVLSVFRTSLMVQVDIWKPNTGKLSALPTSGWSGSTLVLLVDGCISDRQHGCNKMK